MIVNYETTEFGRRWIDSPKAENRYPKQPTFKRQRYISTVKALEMS